MFHPFSVISKGAAPVITSLLLYIKILKKTGTEETIGCVAIILSLVAFQLRRNWPPLSVLMEKINRPSYQSHWKYFFKISCSFSSFFGNCLHVQFHCYSFGAIVVNWWPKKKQQPWDLFSVSNTDIS